MQDVLSKAWKGIQAVLVSSKARRPALVHRGRLPSADGAAPVQARLGLEKSLAPCRLFNTMLLYHTFAYQTGVALCRRLLYAAHWPW